MPSSLWVRLLIGANPRWTLLRLVVLAAATVAVCKFVFLPVRFGGRSMESTCREGAFGFVNATAYLWKEPERGDIVAIRMAGRSVMYLKRVIGLPGEKVAIIQGRVQRERLVGKLR